MLSSMFPFMFTATGADGDLPGVSSNEGSNPHYCEWCIVSTSHRRGSVTMVSRIAPGWRYEFHSLFNPMSVSTFTLKLQD